MFADDVRLICLAEKVDVLWALVRDTRLNAATNQHLHLRPRSGNVSLLPLVHETPGLGVIIDSDFKSSAQVAVMAFKAHKILTCTSPCR